MCRTVLLSRKKIPISLEYYGLSHSLAVSQNNIAPEFFLYWYVMAGIGYILSNIDTITIKYCLRIRKFKFHRCWQEIFRHFIGNIFNEKLVFLKNFPFKYTLSPTMSFPCQSFRYKANISRIFPMPNANGISLQIFPLPKPIFKKYLFSVNPLTVKVDFYS